MLMWAARSSTAVVGGLGNLHPLELHMLPPAAWAPIARILNAIEDGARWPWQAFYAKAAFLF